MPSRFKKLCALLFLGLFFFSLPSSAFAQSVPSRVDVLTVKGAIVPVVADYVKRGIAEASKGSVALIIQLDTPGGLVSTTQEIIEAILASPVPVVVYVSPAGGWAGSAGSFITISGHVAAMAPGTFIGAAHPISLAPSGAGQAAPQVVDEKTVNALASSIRSIAQERRRNVEAAEKMVRESLAITDDEAKTQGVVDLRARSLDELLDKLETEIKEVELQGGKRVALRTKDATVNYLPMNISERFLHTISDPNIAYILLSLSMLALIIELSSPGIGLPGIFGALGLLTSLYALGVLGAYWVGIVIILLAFVLLLAEAFITSHGILAIGGVASLSLGSVLLFSGSPTFRISPVLIAGVVIAVSAFFILVITAVVRNQRRPQPTGMESMVGAIAVARTPLKPHGTVFILGELWEAIADEEVELGEEVVITKIEGLKLRVTKTR